MGVQMLQPDIKQDKLTRATHSDAMC